MKIISNYTSTPNFQHCSCMDRQTTYLKTLADINRERQELVESLNMQEVKGANKPEYNVEDSLSKRTAEYLAMFTLTTQNNSNNDIREFYADDKTAAPLITKHDTPCQKKAREIREEFQKLKEVNDPVAALITANKMKKFTQISEFVGEKENNNFIEGIKDTFSTIIRNADLDKYEPIPIALIYNPIVIENCVILSPCKYELRLLIINS